MSGDGFVGQAGERHEAGELAQRKDLRFRSSIFQGVKDGVSTAQNPAAWLDQLDARLKGRPGNFSKVIFDLLKWPIDDALAGQLLPSSDPSFAEVAIPIIDQERQAWRHVLHRSVSGEILGVDRISVILAALIDRGLTRLSTAGKHEQADDDADKGERIHAIYSACTCICSYWMKGETGVDGSRSWNSLIHARASSS